MAYTTLDNIRIKISDPLKQGFDKQIGDGSTKIFKLSHSKVHSESEAIVVNNSSVELEAYDIDYDEGVVIFNTAPTQGHVIEVSYKYAAFRDEEIELYLDENGQSINQTIVTLIEILLADSARRFDYTAGQTNMQPSQVFDHLERLHKIYQRKVESGVDDEKGNNIEILEIDAGLNDCKPLRYDLTRNDEVDSEWSDNNA